MRKYYPKDKDYIIQMIDRIYEEYGEVIYLEGTDRDLLDIDNYYIYQHGEFWIETAPEDKSKIIGSIAVKRDADNQFLGWLKRFYLLSEYRGTGLAKKMHNTVMEWCRLNKISKIHLWSDTRFTRAHFFYNKHGYEQKGMRIMNNGRIPYQEYFFVKFI